MKRSRSAQSGRFGSCFITRKYRAAVSSTDESEPPGCPEPAAVIIVMMSRRNSRHLALSSSKVRGMGTSGMRDGEERRRSGAYSIGGRRGGNGIEPGGDHE